MSHEKSTRLEEKTFSGDFNGKTILRILKQATKHLGLLIGFIACIAAVAVIESFSTYLTGLLIDRGILAEDMEQLKLFTIYHGITFIVASFFFFGFFYCAGRLGELLQYDLRKKLFEHIQTLSFSFFDKTSSGWLLSRMTSDIHRIAELASWMLLDLIWAVLNIAVSVVFMMILNVKLALIVVAVLPLLVITAIKFKKHIIKEYRNVRSINSEITAAYSESINGVRVIKALTKEKSNLKSFGSITDRMHGSSFRAAWLSALFLPAIQFLLSIAIGLILVVGGWDIELKGLTIGGLRTFIGYLGFMLWPLQDLARVFGEMQQSIASAERVFSLIDTEPEILDKENCRQDANFRGEIDFKNVDFWYNKETPVLKEFNLSVKGGETIAIVGPTGGGKSTIVNLVSRFYEPREGSIYFDGEDYTEYAQETLQSRIGVVLQNPHLFSGTVMENIRYGNPDATDEEIYSAVDMASAKDMIERLPKGYQEEVGEEGNLLSMGQRQLISLARTILANPDIIIMDEATSSIDTLTEQSIQHGMKTLLDGRTSFVVAHRLSTIRDADRILVVEDGRIKEEGSHYELLKRQGHYYQLYTSQFRKENSSPYLK